ncbi:hypothetical protein LX16_1224 [Stackebrandtia albiflava]|uniref:Lipoprotein n=1 Tax=Stackebrandtia albiflava TaxID=406432 RepID=A0A562VC96_9ACTN|nr:hypothetical protein [Stackebrandtia albiflava]TWJ15513.1 hypothetical protein LX16_1224 [Stackebrandtia albiflava]
MRVRHVLVTAGVLATTAALTAGCGDFSDFGSYQRDCTITVGEQSVNLDEEQAANAATVTAVGLRRGISDRGLVVALATAWQESKLHNIDYGDRDSLGLFQQRPSQGWGTEEQIMDPRYAAEVFYDHLERVPGWEDMRVTDAAQAVQRSAYPEEYEQWADDSQIMVSAYTGSADGALSCRAVEDGETRSATVAALSQSLRHDWGEDTIYTEDGAKLSVPVNTPQDGWRYAAWLVAHSHGHGVTTVEYDGTTWRAEAGKWAASESESKDPHRVIATVTG